MEVTARGAVETDLTFLAAGSSTPVSRWSEGNAVQSSGRSSTDPESLWRRSCGGPSASPIAP